MPKLKLDIRKYIAIFTFLFLFLSCILVYDVSSLSSFGTYNNPYHFVLNQFFWCVLSFIVFFVIQKIHSSVFVKFAYFIYIFSIVLLLMTIIPSPFKREVLGASRWLILNPDSIFPQIPLIGEISLQPSEFVKLGLCLLLPLVLSSKKYIDKGNMTLVLVLGYTGIASVVFTLQPSFKDIVICFSMAFFSIFYCGLSIKKLAKIGLPIIFCVVAIMLVSGYRIDRIKSFVNLDAGNDLSYHENQLKIAIGSGGLFGLGFGKSIQKHEYVPEVETDSIFAIYSEEFGFVGSLILLGAIFFYLFLFLRAVLTLDGYFERVFAVNVMTWYGVQSFLNLGSITGVIPLTGVPLPLISYGGSSILFFTVSVAILSRLLKEKDKFGIKKRYNF